MVVVGPEHLGDPSGPSDPKLADLASVYQDHRELVWRVLHQQGVDCAMVDDALQDVFVVVWRKLETFDGRRSMKSWLYGIARRVASDYRRGIRRGTRHLHAVPDPDVHPGQGAHDVRIDVKQTVHQLLERIDEPKREVFVLAEIEGMTAPEISEVLGLNVNTVYARLRAARQQFEQALSRHRARQRREWR